jgi:transcriptional regulator with XRE-family HTH domain
MDVGIKIKEYRQLKDMTITALAELIGTTRPYLSDIERGKKTPSLDMLEKIAVALGTSAEDLLVSETSELPPQLKRLMHNAKQLHPDILENINNMVENININYRMVNTDIDGIETEYVVDLDVKPQGLTKEEELEAQKLIHRLKELESKEKQQESD